MAKIKKFGTVPRDGAEPASPLQPKPFTLPGEDHVYTATPPKEAVWQRVQLAGRANAPMHRRIQALLDFVHGTLADPDDAARIEERLLSGADKLDLLDVFPVVRYLSDAWTAEANGKLEEFYAAQGITEDDADADAPPALDTSRVIEGELATAGTDPA